MNALFPLIITFGLMWVLLIRPQQRRVRQHQSVVASLVVGDEVVTTGGLIGTVEEINEDVLTVSVAPGVSVKMLRSAVQNRIGGADEADLDDLSAHDFDPEEIDPEEIDPDEIGPEG
ncbi:MAG: preprotein translocase subunit YajC, partial [Actinomycetota bacterium]|nr:preprotein translocase subunit YajC [Actinomycetota bacterium]